MKRYKRIAVLAAVLAVVCAGTFLLTRYEEQQEQIHNSDEVVLEIPADSVETLSWQTEETSLSFHRDDEGWHYDGDEAFPVSSEKVAALLARYERFGVRFVIENVEDYSQYGLDEPEGIVTLTAGGQTWEIRLGAFSNMDQQRYVDIGDGNVYLVAEDPLDALPEALSGMIQQDAIPDMEQVTEIGFAGAVSETTLRQEESGRSYDPQDMYYVQLDDGAQPLDSQLVEHYLDTIRGLELTEYATYDATEEELEAFGLDEPLLSVTLSYCSTGDSGEELAGTLTLHVGRNVQEQESYEQALAAEETLPAVTKYLRVGDSRIVYQLGEAAYTTLMAAGYDELRHQEVFWADFALVKQIDVTLEGETHSLISASDEEDADTTPWTCEEQEVEISGIRKALAALCADSFTEEPSTQKEEIRLTVYLEDEDFPEVQIVLYRYDGSFCLAEVDGEPVSLIPRSQAVDLIEAVQAIVLN